MGLQVDRENLERLITSFATFSEPGRGVSRLAYTTLERRAHDLFAAEMTALGISVRVDSVGNSIAELAPTQESGLRAIGIGSHLDSVPNGGRFDGVAGVCAAIETARLAVEDGRDRRRPWRFVAFAAEEGARFGQACTGSRVVAGLTSERDLHAFRDKDGVSIYEAMVNVGLTPSECASAQWASEEWHAFLELHVEQGNLLETHDLSIGVVDCISGSSRLLARITGVASHSGGTPMHLRRDALAAAAECALTCERIALDFEHHGTRITVGRFEVQPDSITTIPGSVVFSVDVRDFDSHRQRETAKQILEQFERIALDRGVQLKAELIGDTSPVILPSWLVGMIIEAANGEQLRYRVMPSGASHDAQQISRVTPTGMIFVPSESGLSHVPEEWTSYRQLGDGIRVLFAALTSLDKADEPCGTTADVRSDSRPIVV